jgi:hypothetical protein
MKVIAGPVARIFSLIGIGLPALCSGSSMWPDFINPDMRNFWANQFVFEKYPC